MNGAAELVDRYLQLCEDRDIDSATALLHPDYRAQFPKGTEFDSLPAMIAVPKVYRWVRKLRDRYAVGTDQGRTVVTSLGRLYGEDLNGQPFDSIRYVDIFYLIDDLIVEQIVFNDLSEHRFSL